MMRSLVSMIIRSVHSPELRLMQGALVKTTDENLTSENWELILNLCDKVQDEGEQV